MDTYFLMRGFLINRAQRICYIVQFMLRREHILTCLHVFLFMWKVLLRSDTREGAREGGRGGLSGTVNWRSVTGDYNFNLVLNTLK